MIQRNKLYPIDRIYLNVFAYIKQRGIKIGLDTGFSNHITDIIIERLGWLKNGIIDYVVSSNQVAAGRPQPFMIKKMMQAAGIDDSKQVVKLGDTEVEQVIKLIDKLEEDDDVLNVFHTMDMSE